MVFIYAVLSFSTPVLKTYFSIHISLMFELVPKVCVGGLGWRQESLYSTSFSVSEIYFLPAFFLLSVLPLLSHSLKHTRRGWNEKKS